MSAMTTTDAHSFIYKYSILPQLTTKLRLKAIANANLWL
jgi:hypothetical protein